MRIVRNREIDKNGNKIRLYLKPGILKVRRVINKFVKDIVVLTPAKITATIPIS
jgi:hypothetical protein